MLRGSKTIMMVKARTTTRIPPITTTTTKTTATKKKKHWQRQKQRVLRVIWSAVAYRALLFFASWCQWFRRNTFLQRYHIQLGNSMKVYKVRECFSASLYWYASFSPLVYSWILFLSSYPFCFSLSLSSFLYSFYSFLTSFLSSLVFSSSFLLRYVLYYCLLSFPFPILPSSPLVAPLCDWIS